MIEQSIDDEDRSHNADACESTLTMRDNRLVDEPMMTPLLQGQYQRPRKTVLKVQKFLMQKSYQETNSPE